MRAHAKSPEDRPLAVQPPAAPASPLDNQPHRRYRKQIVIGIAVLALGAVFAIPAADTALNTISTDDAYVNGHVTFVAPRVPGQVLRVLVDDNVRVKAGDVLVELDPEPYQVQVNIKRAALAAAEADLRAADAAVRGTFAQLRGQRWKLQTAIEQVDNQVAMLKARVAMVRSAEATRDRADADLVRAKSAFEKGAGSKQDLDFAVAARKVADAQVKQAMEEVSQIRVSLGLSPNPANGDLAAVPADLNQTFSGVRQSLADLIRIAAQVGLPLSKAEATPQEVLDDFRSRDAHKDVDRIFAKLIPEAPAMKQAEAKVLEARRDLDQAELNLKYCQVKAEIDGVVTRRNVNPGNNIQAGQQVMAIRSLTEIWIDANFKETQLADLRIGQRVEVFADTYGSRRMFRGRITGFTYGTGSTLALLPPQNATGNFVKVVQRLPVRIELEDYQPDDDTLFAGLSVTPYVYYKEAPSGPNAGRRLQELARGRTLAGGRQ
ncbi:MAG TPA: HlyD family secretion protein [Gemmata sp.]|nr:HlyD family secretion protein [Gemmata sp.]